MAQQALVVGLGLFGMFLAQSLARQGGEVIAVDAGPLRVSEAALQVETAIELDAMDEASLGQLEPKSRHVCVCAIGNDNREGSIIVTALRKQLGAQHIIARATDDLHARILLHVGAQEIIRPERSVGERLAIRLSWKNVVNALPLSGNLILTEVQAPEALWGRSVIELQRPARYDIVVSGMQRDEPGATPAIPRPDTPIREGDIMMVVGTEESTRAFTEQM